MITTVLDFGSKRPIFIKETSTGLYRIITYLLSSLIVRLPFWTIILVISDLMLIYVVNLNHEIDHIIRFIFIQICGLIYGMFMGFFIGVAATSHEKAVNL